MKRRSLMFAGLVAAAAFATTGTVGAAEKTVYDCFPTQIGPEKYDVTCFQVTQPLDYSKPVKMRFEVRGTWVIPYVGKEVVHGCSFNADISKNCPG